MCKDRKKTPPTPPFKKGRAPSPVGRFRRGKKLTAKQLQEGSYRGLVNSLILAGAAVTIDNPATLSESDFCKGNRKNGYAPKKAATRRPHRQKKRTIILLPPLRPLTVRQMSSCSFVPNPQTACACHSGSLRPALRLHL